MSEDALLTSTFTVEQAIVALMVEGGVNDLVVHGFCVESMRIIAVLKGYHRHTTTFLWLPQPFRVLSESFIITSASNLCDP